jgi:excinuclease ABC subunit B
VAPGVDLAPHLAPPRESRTFRLVSEFNPQGDQPRAIEQLVAGLEAGIKQQVLLGVTGSGKTFTMAHVIARLNLPTLVLAPNKTLAAQLYGEFKRLFPDNAVEYFVSYYDYYQPEAYIPASDTYIEKDSDVNEEIDQMRHAATRALLSRDDVIIVASVSCIYGLGSPEAYYGLLLYVEPGMTIGREAVLRKLIEIQYQRNDLDFHRGTFRVRGDVVEVFPAYEEDRAVRITFFGDEIDGLYEIDPLRGKVLRNLTRLTVFPASHYVSTRDDQKGMIAEILGEMVTRRDWFLSQKKYLEAQRVEERARFDMEMLQELGYCSGIENYSRYLTGRAPGQPPPCLLDYFPKNWLLLIDESHISVPQVRGMFNGDRSRKQTLVDYGFRLPSALDNRPLNFDEFRAMLDRVIYVSATPADYELEACGGVAVEQVIRPTGLKDPEMEVRPASNQVDDLLGEIRERVERGERVLVTTLTKRLAEDLTEYYLGLGLKVRYLHSDVKTIERVEIIRDLRQGVFDVLIGINLLREGLDLPEVSLVAILDADKEGFLRSTRSLIQTTGRAARNVLGRVILYADRVTESMRRALDETERRRRLQAEFNREHGITPASIVKSIDDVLGSIYEADYVTVPVVAEPGAEYLEPDDIPALIKRLTAEMKRAADDLEFETAAELRDRIRDLQQRELSLR